MTLKSILNTYKDTILMIIGMIVGAVVGMIWGPGASVLNSVADVFLNLLFCIVVPLVFVSVVLSIANLHSGKEMGRLIGTMFAVFIITLIISAIVSAGTIGVLEPARGAVLPSDAASEEVEAVSFNILSQLTVSDFSSLWSRKTLLALVVFAFITGAAIRKAGDKAENLLKILNELNTVIGNFVGYIMKLAPIGLGCYFAAMMGTYGSDVSGPMAKMVGVTWVFCFVYALIVYPVYAFIGGGANGVKLYFRNMIAPAITALGTCSSAASVPVNIAAGEKMELRKDVSSVVFPVGCNLHKEGTCIVAAITISYECSMLGMNIFSPQVFLTAILVAVVGAFIAGAIPTGGNVLIFLTFSMFGFPTSTLGIIMILHALTDAPTTMINVVGDIPTAQLINRFLHIRESKRSK